jgi:hypothetical protein
VVPAVEEELLHPLPRRRRWRRPGFRLWGRLALLAVPSVPLLYGLAATLWMSVLAGLGTPVTARVLARSSRGQEYEVTVTYPRATWRGAAHETRQVLAVSAIDWSGLKPGLALPAVSLGRGALQTVRIETNRRPLEPGGTLLAAMVIVPLQVGVLALLWGRLLRDWWLVAWGRPVRGVVRHKSRPKHLPRYAVSYEYRESPDSAVLYGTTFVGRADYEAARPGEPLTVLHALWNPRWHIAYPFASYAARP